jgi:DNA polymerase kappa
LRPQRSESAGPAEESTGAERKRDSGEGEWEQWPQEDGDPGDNAESRGSSEAASPHRRHGKEIVPNPTREQAVPAEEELWDCPVCARPQPANERQFNEHIDLCLSRQAIRDTVQQDAVAQQQQQQQQHQGEKGTPETKKVKERKRGRPTTQRYARDQEGQGKEEGTADNTSRSQAKEALFWMSCCWSNDVMTLAPRGALFMEYYFLRPCA